MKFYILKFISGRMRNCEFFSLDFSRKIINFIIRSNIQWVLISDDSRVFDIEFGLCYMTNAQFSTL